MLAGGGTIAPPPGALPPWKGFVAIFPALYAAAEKHQKRGSDQATHIQRIWHLTSKPQSTVKQHQKMSFNDLV